MSNEDQVKAGPMVLEWYASATDAGRWVALVATERHWAPVRSSSRRFEDDRLVVHSATFDGCFIPD
ncbi:MAG: hypothetical protein ICV70_02585 [Jiangellaceae bacterium]|nr:hypothetical protein [Jiangellaceae bacterium]